MELRLQLVHIQWAPARHTAARFKHHGQTGYAAADRRSVRMTRAPDNFQLAEVPYVPHRQALRQRNAESVHLFGGYAKGRCRCQREHDRQSTPYRIEGFRLEGT